MAFSPVHSKTIASEDIRDWWQSIVRLRCGYVVDMRSVGEIGRLVRDVASHRVLMPTGETLMERCGLDDSFVSKLFMGRRNDGQAIGWPLF